MDFVFTEEQKMMASAFRELLDGLCTPSSAEFVGEGSAEPRHDAWRRMAEMGIAGALAPETARGLELTDPDVILIAEEAGHAALQEPMIEHAFMAVPMLAELTAGLQGETSSCASLMTTAVETVLPGAAAGSIRLAIGHPIQPFVLGAGEADYLLLAQDNAIHLIERTRAQLTRAQSIDTRRRLYAVKASLNDSTCLASGSAAREALQGAFERGALYCAAESLGLCRRIIDLAVAYARERKQFGQPIGSNQAVKHALANAQVKLEFARPVVYHAATRIQAAACGVSRAQIAISHAKLAATDAADLAARTAIQVFGAMGYSWEVDLHFHLKRAWALAGAWGSRGFHARRVASSVLEGRIPLGPEYTFD